MKIIAAILADLKQSAIGTPSRLAEPLDGLSVLHRTVQRAAAVEGLDGVHVLARPDERDRVAELVAGLPVQVIAGDIPPSPHRDLVRRTRMWSLDNWRGGLGGSCWFDEWFHAAGLLALAKNAGADAVMALPADAPLLNTILAGAMRKHYEKVSDQYRFVFGQGPPGLTPVFLATSILAELLRAGYPPGVTLAYRPDAATPDQISRPCCYQVPMAVMATAERLLADTGEGFARCEVVLRNLGDAADDAVEVCDFIRRHRREYLPALPAELEVELTTQDSLPDSRLRPAGKRVPSRGPLDLATLERVASELAGRDDARLTLGGFGDPLCHPDWPGAVRAVRRAGVFGISIHTTGKRLAEIGPETIMADPPDLLVVRFDAATEAVYAEAQGEPGLDAAVEAVMAIEQARRQQQQILPVVLPAMIKSRLNVTDLEAFFDQWIQRVGSCWIEGYSDRARQMEPLQIASMAPPMRVGCRRLRHRLVMLADGRVVSCDQDYAARQGVGDLNRATLAEVWAGQALQTVRGWCEHLAAEAVRASGIVTEPSGEQDTALEDDIRQSGMIPPLCERCDEWGRP